jgi:Ni,Fe-hydrogenase III large subunit
LENTGVLKKADAERFGCLGFVGRASGLSYDVRIDCPYPPYNTLNIDRIEQQEGDVAARVIQRGKELLASLNTQGQLLEKLTGTSIKTGAIRTAWQTPQPQAEGIGIIEGWRGEIISYLRFDDNGLISRYYPRDPSWFNWPALECLIHGNIVPDFPVCNKSINGSYAGHDL